MVNDIWSYMGFFSQELGARVVVAGCKGNIPEYTCETFEGGADLSEIYLSTPARSKIVKHFDLDGRCIGVPKSYVSLAHTKNMNFVTIQEIGMDELIAMSDAGKAYVAAEIAMIAAHNKMQADIEAMIDEDELTVDDDHELLHDLDDVMKQSFDLDDGVVRSPSQPDESVYPKFDEIMERILQGQSELGDAQVCSDAVDLIGGDDIDDLQSEMVSATDLDIPWTQVEKTAAIKEPAAKTSVAEDLDQVCDAVPVPERSELADVRNGDVLDILQDHKLWVAAVVASQTVDSFDTWRNARR